MRRRKRIKSESKVEKRKKEMGSDTDTPRKWTKSRQNAIKKK